MTHTAARLSRILTDIRQLDSTQRRLLLGELETLVQQETDGTDVSILSLQGLGCEIWEGMDAQSYVRQERESRLVPMILDRATILAYEAEYEDIMQERGQSGTADRDGESELQEWFKENRFLDRDHLLLIGEWKAPHRIRHYLTFNSDEQIRAVTAEAIASPDERFKFRRLQELMGVGPAVASVILHFAHPGCYMIYDARALQSLGWAAKASLSFRDWMRYTVYARQLGADSGLSLRTIDKALWTYSERQGRRLKP